MSPDSKLDVLWNPLSIGSVEVPNRIFVSAHMIAFRGDDDMVNQRYVDYYEERARGGVGLLVTGAEGVHPSGWHAPHFQAWREEAGPRYEALAAAVHGHGSKIFTQLWHAGLQDFGIIDLDHHHPVMGPSGVPSPLYGRIAKAMETEDIEEVIDAFGRSAEIAKAAGIDGVEVSGSHGYLLNSFMSKLNNRREDEYGGSVANRARLAVEVGQEIRRRCGADFPLGLRMIFEEFVGEGGFQPDDSADLLREIHEAGVYDYFGISGGTYHTQWSTILPASSGLRTPYVEHAARARETVGEEVPVTVACGVYQVERAAEIVAAGQADLVAMTRAHMADPDLVRKAREGRGREIRRCIGANQGCVHRQAIGGPSSCTVNPVVGREGRWGKANAGADPTPRRLYVVGAGPAGMKAAEIASSRGHQVTLVDRDDELGGQIRLAAKLPGRGRWADMIDDLHGSLERNGVQIQLGVEATADSAVEAGADLVVVATGATFDKSGFSVFRPDRDAIPGAGEETVLDPVEVAADPSRCGKRVLIIDDFGDTTAMGIAQLLADAGHQVEIATMAPLIGGQAMLTFDAPSIVYPSLAKAGVKFSPSTTVQSIDAGAATLIDVWSQEARTAEFDSIVVNMLRKPEDALYLELRGRGVPVRRIGDCVAPRRVDEAIYEGFELGMEVESLVGTNAKATVGA